MNLVRTSSAALAVLLSLGLVGCGGNAEKRLIGKWELDVDSVKDAAKSEAGDNPGAAIAMGMMDSMKVTLEFKEDNKMTASFSFGGMSKSQNGTWEVVSSSGNDVTIKTEVKNSQTGKTDVDEGSLTFIDDDTIETSPPAGSKMNVGKMTFRRVKE